MLFIKKFSTLNEKQKKIVFNIIESIEELNKTVSGSQGTYREAGGLSGKLWMSDDFDETPE